MKHIPVASDRMPLPPSLVEAMKASDRPISEHGFGDASVGVRWWEQKLGSARPGRVELFEHDGEPRLTRGDLFRLGRAARDADASDDIVLSFVWSVLAWGTGTSQRGNMRRVRSLTDRPEGGAHLEMVREAIAHAAQGDPRRAYSTLIRRGGGKIRGLGPAFFTKVLYFASEGAPGTRCLILDARVASGLARHGWTTMPTTRGTYSYNWHTDTYVSYCELLDRWAHEASERGEVGPVRPDDLERALFMGY